MPKKKKAGKKKGKAKSDDKGKIVGPKVFLVRHGRSRAQDASKKGKDRDTPEFHDCKLSNAGVDEAKNLGKHWLGDITPNAIITSPMSRALQTYCHMRHH